MKIQTTLYHTKAAVFTSIHNIHIPKVYMHKMLAFPFNSKLKFCLIDSGKIIFIEKCVCVNVYERIQWIC